MNLQTLDQAIEEVKKQDWGHEQNLTVGHYCIHCKAHIASAKAVCPTRIARAQQATVVKALRWASHQTHPEALEAADAIEKELEE